MLALLLSMSIATAATCPTGIQTHRRGLIVDGQLSTAWNGEADAVVAGCDEKLVDAVEEWHDQRRCIALSAGIGLFVWPVLGVTVYCAVKENDQRADVERLLK